MNGDGRKRAATRWKEFALLNAGTLLVAFGVSFFKFPNHFSTGGVSGLSIILGALVPRVSSGTFVWIFNAALMMLGFWLINGSFGTKTVYSSMLYSAVIWAMERVCPLEAPLTTQPFLELIFSVLLPAFGSAILFNIDASTGGTDITAMILRKYTHMDIGRALIAVDLGITIAACFVFGIEAGLYSILGLLMKAFLVDSLIESFNTCKYFNIVTSQPEVVTDFVVHALGRSATEIEATGVFSHEKRALLLVVLTRPQAAKLNRFLRQTDPGAFITIMNTSSIIGKGFRAPA